MRVSRAWVSVPRTPRAGPFMQDGTEQFMAIVKKAEVDPARGLVYMTTEGAILCVSEGFTNLFGWSSKDVSGQTLLNVAEEALEINQALTIIKDTLVLEQTKSSPEAPRQRRRSVPLASRLSSAAEGTSQKERKDSARLSGQGARGQKVMGAYAKRPSIEGRAGMVQGVLANMKHRYLKKTLQAHADFGIVGTTENAVLEVSFRLVDDIFGVFAAGRDGRLVFVNTAVEVALGYPRGSLLEGGATIGHLMPPGMGRFHQGRLHRTLTSGEPSPVHVPCKMGQTVAMRGNQSTRVPARLSWQILKPTDNAPPLYVCQLQKVPFDPSLGAWGFRSGDGLIERQICLRMLCCQRGQILGVGHGWGFVKTTVPGGIFGIDARTLLGQNLSDVIDALSGTVKVRATLPSVIHRRRERTLFAYLPVSFVTDLASVLLCFWSPY